ncbi:MAG: hypothetical protein KF729_19195 [Sandaracinaceae bacterium]|nr:hypothetical protein [Sandaracinaceae bacterium]
MRASRRAIGIALGAALVACGTRSAGSSAAPAAAEPATPAPTGSAPAAARAPAASARRWLGSNLAEPSYWGGTFPFVDLMKHSDPWTSGTEETWNDRRPIETDAHGWVRRLAPGQIARVFIFGSEQWHPAGRVTVRFAGRGTIEYRGSVRDVVRGEGEHTLEVPEGSGLYLEITEVDPRDPLRDIRVIAPGGRCEEDVMAYCEADAQCTGRCVPFTESYREIPFHPTFLSDIRAYGALRFMDWQATNRGRGQDDAEELPLPRRWADLPTRESRSWKPVPVDVMVELANLVGADPWFSIPHTAEDQLIRQFAATVAARLDRARRVYVEYTNEGWNDIFDQHQWMNGEGCRRYSRAARRECDPDGNGVLCEYTPWNATQGRCLTYGRRFFTERTVQIGAIWRGEFRDVEPERVRRVMGAQIGGADWWIGEFLQREVDGAPAHTQVDVVAVAPYFGRGSETSLEEIFRRVPAGRADGVAAGTFHILVGSVGSEEGEVFQWIQRDLAALRRELPAGAVEYVAYEGGQHLTSHEEDRVALFHRANRDPRMEALYLEYLTMWRTLTGDALFLHYTSPGTWTRFGTWGAMERQGAPLADSPKQRALSRAAAAQ